MRSKYKPLHTSVVEVKNIPRARNLGPTMSSLNALLQDYIQNTAKHLVMNGLNIYLDNRQIAMLQRSVQAKISQKQ